MTHLSHLSVDHSNTVTPIQWKKPATPQHPQWIASELKHSTQCSASDQSDPIHKSTTKPQPTLSFKDHIRPPQPRSVSFYRLPVGTDPLSASPRPLKTKKTSSVWAGAHWSVFFLWVGNRGVNNCSGWTLQSTLYTHTFGQESADFIFGLT